MASVSLIQGASRGIGLQFCRSLLSKNEHAVVVATCRSPESSTLILDLQKQHPNRLHLHKLDVTRTSDIEKVCERVKEDFGRLDLLINAAGMLHPSGRGETSLRDVSDQALQQTLATNTIGPLMMAKYFGPLLVNGNGHFGVRGSNNNHTAILVNMSAKVGSITDNGLGGWYSYRLSKAALNMATKNLSIEMGRGKKKVVCISLHPGTVDTDLSRPYHKNVPKLFSTEESVGMMMDVIDSLSINDSGKFFTYDRTQLPF